MEKRQRAFVVQCRLGMTSYPMYVTLSREAAEKQIAALLAFVKGPGLTYDYWECDLIAERCDERDMG